MTNKFQITKDKKRKTGDERQKLNNRHSISVWFFGNWNLFVIYYLRFEFYNPTQRTFAKIFRTPIIVSLILLLVGCSYSFTGSSVPSHLKSIAIPFCTDRSGSGEPGMADNFTSTLIEHFISDNSLAVTDKSDADSFLECTITSISDAPTVIKGGENVSARRITIKAHVVYKDFVKKKTVFDKSFSNYGDYENEGDIISARSNAIKAATDLITEDILLGVVSNW
ncbi:MAG: LptE family protein [Melioribacteraceae bacterium]